MLFDKDVFKGNNNFNEEDIIFEEDVNGIQLLDEVTKLINKNGSRPFCLTVDKENETHNIGGDIKYFKFYNNINPTKSSGVARISLVKPIYIIHPSSVPRTIYLDRTQKKSLVEFLNNRCKTPTDNGILLETNFQYLIYYFNKVMFNTNTEIILNYTKNTKTSISNMVHIDQEMPDYMKLIK